MYREIINMYKNGKKVMVKIVLAQLIQKMKG